MHETVRVRWIHLFLHISWFSFPPEKFLLSSSPSASSPATPVCCPSREVHSTRREERGNGKEGERRRGRGEDCSWLAAVCVLWIAFEFKGNAAFLTVWQNKRSNVMQWRDGWMDGWRPWKKQNKQQQVGGSAILWYRFKHILFKYPGWLLSATCF